MLKVLNYLTCGMRCAQLSSVLLGFAAAATTASETSLADSTLAIDDTCESEAGGCALEMRQLRGELLRQRVSGSLLKDREEPGKWTAHPGMNCYANHGADGIQGKDPMPNALTESQCKQECMMESECSGIEMPHGLAPRLCFLRKNLRLSACLVQTPYDFWALSEKHRQAEDWLARPGMNCFANHGAKGIQGKDPMPQTLRESQCKNACMTEPECAGIVMPRGRGDDEPRMCFLRKNVQAAACEQHTPYDFWQRGVQDTSQAVGEGAAEEKWTAHPGMNCYINRGAEDVEGRTPVIPLLESQCKNECLKHPECTSIFMSKGTGPRLCYLRKNLQVDACERDSPYDAWTRHAIAHSKPAVHETPPQPGDAVPLDDVEKYLSMIDDFMDKQPRQSFLPGGAGLLQTFGPHSIGGGSCGDELCKLPEPCPFGNTGRCRFDVYDNAVAAIYLTKRGKLVQARRILDAFLHLLYPRQQVHGLSFGPRDQLPSGRFLTLLGASYHEGPVDAGTYSGASVADGGVDTGNNAWVGIAFAQFASASGQACFAEVAHDILRALKVGNKCEDKLRGFKARLRPWPGKYRSSEHNTDMFALARILGDKEVESRAGQFVQSMYEYDARYKQVYAEGTDGAVDCDTSTRVHAPIAADAQLWNLLADVDPAKDRKRASLSAVLRPMQDGGMLTMDKDVIGNAGGGVPLVGVRFTNWGNGVQWENTASAVMAMSHYRNRFGTDVPGADLTERINAMRSSLLKLLDRYKSVPASVLGGNYNAWKKNDHSATFPGGSDTGIDWTYYRYPHLTATAWTGLMLLYQSNDQAPVNLDANPFAPPAKPVPGLTHDLRCLPPAR